MSNEVSLSLSLSHSLTHSLIHSLTLSLSLSISHRLRLCCFVLLEPTCMLYRVPSVSPGVTAPILCSPPSRATPRASLSLSLSLAGPPSSLQTFFTDHCRVPGTTTGRRGLGLDFGLCSSPKCMKSAQLLVGVLFSNRSLFSRTGHKSDPFENKTPTNNWADFIHFGDECSRATRPCVFM